MMEEPMQINVDTSDALEMGPAQAGEYKVQIINAKFKSGEGSQGPWKGIALMLDLPDKLDADIFNHMVWIPDQENQEPKRYERSKADFDKFKRAFGYEPSEAFTVQDLEGREAWARLTVKEDPEYGPQNKVQQWVTGPSGNNQPSY